MRKVLVCLAIGGIGLWTATPAGAQVHLGVDTGIARAAQDRSFVAVSLGIRVLWIEVDGEVGRYRDLLPTGVEDGLNQLQDQLNLPVRATASMPATYALGQVRLIGRSGPVQPFVSVGVGAARVQPRFDVEVAGISFGDVFGLTSSEPTTDRMLTGGAGLRIPLGSAHLEAGYRYVRIYKEFSYEGAFDDSRLRTKAHTVYAGLGLRF